MKASSGYSSLGETVGCHSIDSVESELITKFINNLVAPGLFLFFRGMNHLAFTRLPDERFRRPLSVEDLGGLLFEDPAGQTLPCHLLALGLASKLSSTVWGQGIHPQSSRVDLPSSLSARYHSKEIVN